MLTTHNAEIRTATVEVKTLTLSGKQVTLSVFRQLRERPLVSTDDGITLNGTPWGVVEYHPDPKLCPDGEHLHLIWSNGEGIFRSTVTPPPATFGPYTNSRHGKAYIHADLRERLLRGEDVDDWRAANRVVVIAGIRVHIASTTDGAHAVVARRELDDLVAEAEQKFPNSDDWQAVSYTLYLPRRAGRGRPDSLSVRLPAAIRYHWHRLDEALAPLGSESVEQALLRLSAEVEEAVRERQSQEERYQFLAGLSQLFIAV